MKLFQNIFKLSYTLGFLFIGQNLFGQTPKEIELPLKLAQFIGIKVCDSYTLSYFIKEEMDGKPVYNNGLLVQNAKKGKVQNKKWRNQKMIPLQNFYTAKDTIVTETIQQSDSIFQYVNKNNYKIKVKNRDLIYKYQFTNNPQIKSLNFPTKDSVFNTIVQVTKDAKGNTMKQWNQNKQLQKRMNPKKIVQKIDTLKLNYREDNKKLFLYDLNEESKIISKRFIGLSKKEEGISINVGGESIELSRIWTMRKLSNTSYLVEFRTKGEDYQINYTVDDNYNNLQSFIYQKIQYLNPEESIYNERGALITTHVGFAIEYNFLSNAIIMCN